MEGICGGFFFFCMGVDLVGSSCAEIGFDILGGRLGFGLKMV